MNVNLHFFLSSFKEFLMELNLNCKCCGRPLQQKRQNCIYCHQSLDVGELEQLDLRARSEDMLVSKARAESIMHASAALAKKPGKKAKLQKRLIVTFILLAISLTWISGWNIWVLLSCAVVFSVPIYRMFRRSSS
jgi:hypothetical protein